MHHLFLLGFITLTFFMTVLLLMDMIVFYLISINKSVLYMSVHILSFFRFFSLSHQRGGEWSEHAIAKYFISSWVEPWKRARQSRDRDGNILSGHTGLKHVIWH